MISISSGRNHPFDIAVALTASGFSEYTTTARLSWALVQAT